jgi:TolB-like protein
MSSWEVGSKVGPYVLVAGIGSGGMGEVWKARDTRLGRVVALKRLHVQSAAFEREARTIASLNHPNICTLHDIGADYLVMEYLEGPPLMGPLDVSEAVRLALQIATALEAAHTSGVIHCDLKPANVVVVGGRAKLLDFGVAKLRRDSGSDATMTVEGGIGGTPAYMAPEQAQGKPPDARSDIFSFGAVLYEMLSGRRAFSGASTADVVSAVLRDHPPALQAPDSLVRIVKRCLEKVPANRFQNMAELTAALERVLSIPVAQPPSIAVLPFANMSSDPELEYFSDGLTEEIINALAHVRGLKVIARTSAFAFKGQNTDIRRIAESLGVTNVLEGSVRKGGNRIRVTAQLIKVEDGCHLWSEHYDRELADVFAVQDEIAAAIATELRGKLAVELPARRTHTPSVAAYEAYLMARHHQWKLTPDALDLSRTCYEQAIALDPTYALAQAGLAEHFHIRASTSGAAGREAAALVRPAAERALALDPTLPEAHAWLGIVATTYEYDWAEGERRFRAATAQEPVAPRHRHLNGYFHLRFIGRTAEAVAEHRRALQEDPLNLIMRVGLAASLTSDGRHVEASSEARRLLELDPDFPATYTLLALNVANEPLPVALAYVERGYALAPWSPGITGLLAGLARRSGDERRAEMLLHQVGDPEEYGNAVGLALFHLACSETERAIDWLEKLVEQRHPFVMMLLVGGPYAPLLRASPRWPSVARSMNLPTSDIS